MSYRPPRGHSPLLAREMSRLGLVVHARSMSELHVRSSTAHARRSQRPRSRQPDVSSSSGRGSPAASAHGWRDRSPSRRQRPSVCRRCRRAHSSIARSPVSSTCGPDGHGAQLEPGRAGRQALHRAIRRIEHSGEIVEAGPGPLAGARRGVTSVTVRGLGLAAAGTVVAAGCWAPSLAVIMPAAGGVLGVRNRFSDLDGVVLTFDDGPHPARYAGGPCRAPAGVGAGDLLRHRRGGRARSRAAREVSRGGPRDRDSRVPPSVAAPVGGGSLRDDTLRALTAVLDATEKRPRFYRPPHGTMMFAGRRTVCRLALEPLLWSRWGKDWRRGATPERSRERNTGGRAWRRRSPARLGRTRGGGQLALDGRRPAVDPGDDPWSRAPRRPAGPPSPLHIA